MTDRELLELAAKAAGMGPIVWGETYKLGDDEIDCSDIPYIRSGQPDELDFYWNPLSDDGDALRLAVKLGICPSVDETAASAMVSLDEVSWCDLKEVGNDPCAATRRAITRAAAEIGRAMCQDM